VKRTNSNPTPPQPALTRLAEGSTAICILGAHRSGTSTVTRAINLLGAYVGQKEELMPPTPANPEGYWERLDIWNYQEKLLSHLGRTWHSVAPLSESWQQSPALGPFKQELKKLISDKFANRPLWAWKDPRTCLLLPLWRDVLDEEGIRLRCVFVVRSPLDVALSLYRRDQIPLNKAFGLWFSHNLAALESSAGLPIVLLGYDKFLESWESQLRRCAGALDLKWPGDEHQLLEEMKSFIRPGLRHSRSTPEDLRGAPQPVVDLYDLLLDASRRPEPPDERFYEAIHRLHREFQGYSSFYEAGLDNGWCKKILASLPPGTSVRRKDSFLKRTSQRWTRSLKKRLKPKNSR
jgi:hypothetical protein